MIRRPPRSTRTDTLFPYTTLFRSLKGVPRNTAKPGYFSNFGLSADGDARLTAWMHTRLLIAVWPAPRTLDEPLATTELGVIRRWHPPLNISGNPYPLPALSAARKRMAMEASQWRAAHSA